MEVTQDIKLNINDTGDRYVVTVKQGDTGRKLSVTMCDGQTELTIPSTATVSVRVLKADGTSVDDTATVSDGKAIVELTEQMTAVVGYAKADVSVASDGKIVSTATFLLKVGSVPLGVAIVSENEFTQLSQLIASASSYESRIGDLEEAIEGGTGLSDEAKQALLTCFEHVAWVDEHGQDYVDALETALYPPANLVSISAVYTQSGTVYDTDSLDDLKSDLVVTAHYSDSTTEVVTTYTLSGTLAEGTSTITVAYGGKTTTFNVVVTSAITTVAISSWINHDGVATRVISNNYIDANNADAYITIPYIADASGLADGVTAESVCYGLMGELFTYDNDTYTNVGYYYGGDIHSSYTSAQMDSIVFDTKYKFAPSGYYVRPVLLKKSAFTSNATAKTYANTYVTNVELHAIS